MIEHPKLQRNSKIFLSFILFFFWFFHVSICANYIQVLLYILYSCSSPLLRFFMKEPIEMHYCRVSSRWLYIQNITSIAE
jgi:hypothetical protein